MEGNQNKCYTTIKFTSHSKSHISYATTLPTNSNPTLVLLLFLRLLHVSEIVALEQGSLWCQKGHSYHSQVGGSTFSQALILPSYTVSNQQQSIGFLLIAVTVGCCKHRVKYVDCYDIQKTAQRIGFKKESKNLAIVFILVIYLILP